jgi:NAD(P)-dependent dehydrogenase (short-subunit alcohol dehydrogenase family)
MKRLEGKRAFVTGAGRGIGKAIAARLAEAGAAVAIADIDGDNAASAASGIPGSTAVTLDVSDRAAVHAAVGSHAAAGGLDILVNNAVFFYYAPLVDMPEDVVGRMLDVGIKGTFWATQAATPHLRARGGGSIVNLSSVAVSFAIRNAAVYTSIKGAVDAFTRQQAVELAEHNIRVNALAPGSTATPGASSVIDDAGWEKRRQMTPLKRLMGEAEIGAAAVYLCSDDAINITGVTLKIDGGLTISGPR